mmetsp:Transcript_18732/g.28046  ORF Transcript_18732/g.28046 Transcript_18732/m.28046 type:complete len:1213 (+) Transcript_18732:67-3705(+)
MSHRKRGAMTEEERHKLSMDKIGAKLLEITSLKTEASAMMMVKLNAEGQDEGYVHVDEDFEIIVETNFREATIFHTPSILTSEEPIYLSYNNPKGVRDLQIVAENTDSKDGLVRATADGKRDRNSYFKMVVNDAHNLTEFQSVVHKGYRLAFVEHKDNDEKDSTNQDGHGKVFASKLSGPRTQFIVVRRIMDLRHFQDLLKLANADVTDPQTGETPLIRAARLGRAEFVYALIQNRVSGDDTGQSNIRRKQYANVTLKDYDGNTALCVAASNGWLAIVVMLVEVMKRIDSGSAIHSRNSDGWDARLCAAVYGHPSILYYLNLDKTGEDLKVLTDKKNNSALHLAATAGHPDVVEMLIELFELGLEDKNDKNWTPLMCAYYNGWGIVSGILAAHGAEVRNERDRQIKDEYGIEIQLLYCGSEELKVSEAAKKYRKVDVQDLNTKILFGKRIFNGLVQKIRESKVNSSFRKSTKLDFIRKLYKQMVTMSKMVISDKLKPRAYRKMMARESKKLSQYSKQNKKCSKDTLEHLHSYYNLSYRRDSLVRVLSGHLLERERKHYLSLGEYSAAVILITSVTSMILESNENKGSSRSGSSGIDFQYTIELSVKRSFFESNRCFRIFAEYNQAKTLRMKQMVTRKMMYRNLDIKSATRLYHKGIEVLKTLPDNTGMTDVKQFKIYREELYEELEKAAKHFWDAHTLNPTERKYRNLVAVTEIANLAMKYRHLSKEDIMAVRESDEKVRRAKMTILIQDPHSDRDEDEDDFDEDEYDSELNDWDEDYSDEELRKLSSKANQISQISEENKDFVRIVDKWTTVSPSRTRDMKETKRPVWLKPTKPISPFIDATAWDILYPLNSNRGRGCPARAHIRGTSFLSEGPAVQMECTSLYRIFHKLDADKNGSVDIRELESTLLDEKNVLQLTGKKDIKMSASDVARNIMEKYDKDGDGSITASEFFFAYLRKHFAVHGTLQYQSLSKWISEIYYIFADKDRAGTGKVTMKSLQGEKSLAEELVIYYQNKHFRRRDATDIANSTITFGNFVVGLLVEEKRAKLHGRTPMTSASIDNLMELRKLEMELREEKWKKKRFVILYTTGEDRAEKTARTIYRDLKDSGLDSVLWEGTIFFHFHSTNLHLPSNTLERREFEMSFKIHKLPTLELRCADFCFRTHTRNPLLIAHMLHAFQGNRNPLETWIGLKKDNLKALADERNEEKYKARSM